MPKRKSREREFAALPKLNIIWLPSPNFNERPPGVKPWVIVLHSTEGKFQWAVDWLRNPKSRVSSHFVVSRSGRIAQLVPTDKRAWHAGESAYKGQDDVNDFSIGIEMEHRDGKEDFPDRQLQAVAALCKVLMATYGIKAADIVSHAKIAIPPGRKKDPQDFPWAKFRAMLKA